MPSSAPSAPPGPGLAGSVRLWDRSVPRTSAPEWRLRSRMWRPRGSGWHRQGARSPCSSASIRSRAATNEAARQYNASRAPGHLELHRAAPEISSPSSRRCEASCACIAKPHGTNRGAPEKIHIPSIDISGTVTIIGCLPSRGWSQRRSQQVRRHPCLTDQRGGRELQPAYVPEVKSEDEESLQETVRGRRRRQRCMQGALQGATRPSFSPWGLIS
jgi:hypothetical protein